MCQVQSTARLFRSSREGIIKWLCLSKAIYSTLLCIWTQRYSFFLTIIFYIFIKWCSYKKSAQSLSWVKTAGICCLYCLPTCNISKGKNLHNVSGISTSNDGKEQINSCSMLATKLCTDVKISHDDPWFHRSLFKDFNGKYGNQNACGL